MTELQVQSTIKYMCELWPDWTATNAALLQFQELFKYAEEDKVLEILKEAWGQNDYKSPPKKFILKAVEKIKKSKPFDIIMVYALRHDGKNMTVGCRASNPDHADNVMTSYMNHYADLGHDCEPMQFTFYIGEENYYRFTAARYELRNEVRRTG